MRVLTGIISCAILASSGANAFTQVIDDDTKCAAIENIIQTSSPDKEKVKEVVDYIVETMRALDRVHARKGKTEIFPQLTEDGRSALALIVTDRCRIQGSLTVADTAIETYEAIRAAKPSFVQSKLLQKWAHSNRWHQHSLVSKLGQHPVPRATAQQAKVDF